MVPDKSLTSCVSSVSSALGRDFAFYGEVYGFTYFSRHHF